MVTGASSATRSSSTWGREWGGSHSEVSLCRRCSGREASRYASTTMATYEGKWWNVATPKSHFVGRLVTKQYEGMNLSITASSPQSQKDIFLAWANAAAPGGDSEHLGFHGESISGERFTLLY